MDPNENQGTPAWRLTAFDPPDEARAREMSAFMRSQHEGAERNAVAKNQIFHWKLRRNPVHPGFASAMVTTADDRIVSLCTVTPKRFWVRGAERTWGEIGDTFTDPAFQRRGMFSALVNASRSRSQAAGCEVVYGLPNEQSAPGYTGKLNFPIKADAGHVNRTLPLSSRALATRLSGDARAWQPAARAVLQHPAVAAASRGFAWSLLTRPGVDGIVVAEQGSFGDEFDALWRAVRPSLAVAQVRDARYLAWRFRDNAYSFRVFAARRRGELVGYLATLTLPDDGDFELRRMYVVDWLFAPSETATVGRALLQAALRPALDEGVDIVTTQVVRAGPLQLPWKLFGFMERPWTKPVIIHRNEAGASALDDPSPWHFTLGDTDAF